MTEKLKGAVKQWQRYKYAAAAAVMGAALLLLPTGGGGETIRETPVRDLERELEEILSAVSGVGEVKVLLSVESDGEKELARDTEVRYSGSTDAPEDYSRTSSAVILEGERGDESLVIRSSAPTYRGAVVVCSGGDRPEVRLAVTEAVTALTGLTSDRVAVAKWQ
ncbi:MAG: hypothetical protein IJF36_02260 [Oscillibacter sp.]|nr:hypothetical protein [Oscillibacter sp.]